MLNKRINLQRHSNYFPGFPLCVVILRFHERRKEETKGKEAREPEKPSRGKTGEVEEAVIDTEQSSVTAEFIYLF